MAIIGSGITIGPGIIFSSIPGLYTFTNFTFTTANLVGASSGNLTQFKANYNTSSNTWINDTSYYNITTPGYQIWTVPTTGTYEIEAAGSRSGNVQPAANLFGYGAIVRARVSLTQGSNVTIAVGQPSANVTQVSTYCSAGGGGGTWVVQGNVALVVAGGGGGVGFWTGNTPNYRISGNGVTSTWAGNSFNGAAGGTLGQGGSSHLNISAVPSINAYDSGGGGGWISNGVNGINNVRTNTTNGSTGGGGQGWNANLLGGVNATTYPSPATSPGGFGGGGGASPISGGGGGGYSGGGGGYSGSATSEDSGGGGGSYIIANATVVATSDGNYNGASTFGGASITNIGTFNANPGYVKITYIG